MRICTNGLAWRIAGKQDNHTGLDGQESGLLRAFFDLGFGLKTAPLHRIVSNTIFSLRVFSCCETLSLYSSVFPPSLTHQGRQYLV